MLTINALPVAETATHPYQQLINLMINRLIKNMRSCHTTILAVFMIIFICPCFASNVKEVKLPDTNTKFLTSKINGIKYVLFISLPEGYHTNKKHYPVLYLLDPDTEFPMTSNIAHNLINYGTINSFILVGIGYQNQSLQTIRNQQFWQNYSINRTRDYIPFKMKSFEHSDGDEYKSLAKHAGGSEEFKDFLQTELIPYIDESYRTTKERGIEGHSLGGLFVSWLIQNYPTIFSKYLILSPSLWLSNVNNKRLTGNIKKTPKNTCVYFAAGSLEKGDNGDMAIEVGKFYNNLPTDKSFNKKFEVLNNENHVSMVPAALTDGLRFLFDTCDK